MSSTTQQTSRLLTLPTELQLQIFEYVVVQCDQPLHINCPCDSSYGGWTPAFMAAKKRWESGAQKAPQQPQLARVCRSIRALALPLFYSKNRFQAGYCHSTDLGLALRWLEAIGPANRALLRNFYFFDGNEDYDSMEPADLKRLLQNADLQSWASSIRPRPSHNSCRHDVVFASADRPIARRMVA